MVAIPVHADDNFWIDLNTTYQVSQRGATRVEHSFTITNRTPSYAINRYSLQVSSAKLTNVSVMQGDKPLNPNIQVNGQITTLAFDFPEKQVGEGKQLVFTVVYTNPDLAQVNGQVLEVAIPPLAQADHFRNYTVKVLTPLFFSYPARTSPAYKNQTIQGDMILVEYDRTASQGITSVYGDSQYFSLRLSYPLENSGSQPVLTQITLPPDTATQRMSYQQIDPLPDDWKIDPDGNWLATYTLPAHTSFSVSVQALARITLEPAKNIPILQPLPQHTESDEFWSSQQAEIKAIAKDHPQPQQLYSFVTEALTYTTADLSQDLPRLGAVKVLSQPTAATCQEYTDLFVALARANKIPTRRILGYAQTQNQALRPVGLAGDILHAWPEYFDNETQQWKAIDPTWGDTTGGVDYFNQMDLNHLVFAINGTSSTLPYPVGSYKVGEKPGKTIEVAFADNFPELKPEIDARIVPKKIGPLSIPGWYEIWYQNVGGMARYNLNTSLDSLQLHTANDLPTVLLPFQTVRVPFFAYNTDQASTLTGAMLPVSVSVSSDGTTVSAFETTLYAFPSILSRLSYHSTIVAVAISFGLVAAIAGGIFFLVSQWTNSLRRQSQKSQTPGY